MLIPKNQKVGNISQEQIESSYVCFEANKILKSIINEDLFNQIKIISYSKKVLKVHTNSSIVSQEVLLNKRKFLELLKKERGIIVEKIRFTNINE